MPPAADEVCEAIVTAPDPDWLVEFTRQLVIDRLCASGHNFAPIRTLYRWQGQVHDTTEGRVALRTRRSLLPQIVDRAKWEHPSEVPSVVAVPIIDGGPDYLGGSSNRPNNLPGSSCEQLSWWEPRSPTTPRVEGSGRAVPGMPDPSRKRYQPTRHPSRARSAVDPVGPTSLALPLAPEGLSACHGIHRSSVPRGRADRPARQQEGARP